MSERKCRKQTQIFTRKMENGKFSPFTSFSLCELIFRGGRFFKLTLLGKLRMGKIKASKALKSFFMKTKI
jgi:hypothetical protein